MTGPNGVNKSRDGKAVALKGMSNNYSYTDLLLGHECSWPSQPPSVLAPCMPPRLLLSRILSVACAPSNRPRGVSSSSQPQRAQLG